MARNIFVDVVLLLVFASAAAGCSHAQTLTDLLCDCAECDEHTEAWVYERLASLEEGSDAYDCGEAFSTYADCLEEHGKCEVDGWISTGSVDSKGSAFYCDEERVDLQWCVYDASDDPHLEMDFHLPDLSDSFP